MDYPAEVERHFRDPSNAGALDGVPVARGEAGSAEAGTWIVVEAEIVDATIRRIAFRAFACPFLIAACSRVTELVANGPAVRLARFDVDRLVGELGIPPEKLGGLLVLEDALRNCWTDWDTTQPAGHP